MTPRRAHSTPHYLAYGLTTFPHWRVLDVSLCLHLALLSMGMVCLRQIGVRPTAAVATVILVLADPTFAYMQTKVVPWILAWVAHALITDPRHVMDANINHEDQTSRRASSCCGPRRVSPGSCWSTRRSPGFSVAAVTSAGGPRSAIATGR